MVEITVRNYHTHIDDTYKPFLLVCSGADSFGWARDDSDVDLRCVWVQNLRQLVSIQFRGKTKHTISGVWDWAIYPLRNFLYLLVKGSPNQLEQLHMDMIMGNKDKVKELQEITMRFLHKRFLRSYSCYAHNLKKDCTHPKRLAKVGITKYLLDRYRVLRAGLILGHYHEVVYNYLKQDEYYESDYTMQLLCKYLASRSLSTDEISSMQIELDSYASELRSIIKITKLRKVFPSIVFDRFLYDLYDID